MADEPTAFSALLAGYGTTALGEGLAVQSVFALLKVRAEDGSAAWSVRSGGAPVTSEELLGVLDGLTTSMRQRLTMAWRGQSPPASTGAPPAPIQFSELLAGVETVAVGREYVIESVFAVIKARRVDGAPAWFVRSSEMKLSAEERLGASRAMQTPSGRESPPPGSGDAPLVQLRWLPDRRCAARNDVL